MPRHGDKTHPSHHTHRRPDWRAIIHLQAELPKQSAGPDRCRPAPSGTIKPRRISPPPSNLQKRAWLLKPLDHSAPRLVCRMGSPLHRNRPTHSPNQATPRGMPRRENANKRSAAKSQLTPNPATITATMPPLDNGQPPGHTNRISPGTARLAGARHAWCEPTARGDAHSSRSARVARMLLLRTRSGRGS